MEVVANWRVGLETTQNLSEDEEELLMNLSSAYVRWREDTLREGRIEGRIVEIEKMECNRTFSPNLISAIDLSSISRFQRLIKFTRELCHYECCHSR